MPFIMHAMGFFFSIFVFSLFLFLNETSVTCYFLFIYFFHSLRVFNLQMMMHMFFIMSTNFTLITAISNIFHLVSYCLHSILTFIILSLILMMFSVLQVALVAQHLVPV